MKRVASLAALLAIAVAASSGCDGKPAPEAAAASERKLATATVEGVEAPAVLEVDGVIVGASEAVLSSRLAAPIVEVRAVPGRSVRAGEILVRLADRESDMAVTSARAAVAAARASWEVASRNRQRFERLEGRGAAAAVELDRARQDEADAASAAASAQAALARADTDRGQSVLEAPFDAIVVEKMVSAGDLAAPGRPLVRLASTTGRRVEAAPGEEDAARLSVGQSIPILLGGTVVDGRVVEIVGAVDPATRRRIVRVDLPYGVEPPVGSFARLRLAGEPTRRLLVSDRAVVSRGGLQIAWAVGRDGRVSLRYVRTGAAAGAGVVEVRSGLEAGERVVLDPPDDLTAGTRAIS
jgi:RND family efflux transporter MFP subunit